MLERPPLNIPSTPTLVHPGPPTQQKLGLEPASPEGKKVLRPAAKKMLLGAAPPVLMLHLKRFEHTSRGLAKVNTSVSFPLELQLAPFCVAG